MALLCCKKRDSLFGGFDAQMLSMDIAKHIYLESKKASELLAKNMENQNGVKEQD